MNAEQLVLKKNIFISWLIFFCHREGSEIDDKASIFSSSATSMETDTSRCLINHTYEYSPTTKSKLVRLHLI
jgi:hypothetical protein